MDDLLPEFIAETRETLQAAAGALVAWEADPADRARLDEIFRFVHTVKGSCGFFDLPRLQRLSHAAEDALAEVRSGARVADVKLVSAILAIVDRIGVLTDALETGISIPDEDEPRLIAALSAIAPRPEDFTIAGTQPRGAAARSPARTVRLPVELLDRIMGSVSEMVLARNELAHDIGRTGSGNGAFERLSLCVGELRDAVTRARMARVDTLFAGLPRLVRDLSIELGKPVRLVLDGGEVELDREMIEMVRDPLLHVVRNAIDHGIEPVARRLAAGKPAEGLIAMRAWQSGSRILIEVADDGAGIDVARVVERAVAAEVISARDAAQLPPARALDLIFHPGLSTAREVTGLSGRGVGMDVVRANIERLGGSLTLDNRPGEGLRLVMEVPLTLTIIPALTIGVGDQCFAIARTTIDEIVRVSPAIPLETVGGGMLTVIRGARLPVASLAQVIGADHLRPPPLLVILRTANGGRYALGVDAVHDHEELVIKPAAPGILASGLFAGTTLPDNSRPMLLLDVAGIAAAAGVTPVSAPVEAVAEAPLPTRAALLFREVDGVERLAWLDEVERIEEVAREAAIEGGGRRLLASGGTLVPLHAGRRGLGASPKLCVLRLTSARGGIAYVIDRVLDIVDLPSEIAAAAMPGPVAGVLLYAGRPLEVIDAAWLAERGGAILGGPVAVDRAAQRAA